MPKRPRAGKERPPIKRAGKTEAARADRYRLYQKAVQDPKREIAFMGNVYQELRGKPPLRFREDFCGTAHLAAGWVKSDERRTALGIDLDPTPLAWGDAHVLAKLSARERGRLRLKRANVLDVSDPKVDVTCALNFSYCVFKERAELLRYFQVAHAGLADDGVFFCELFGGTEAIVTLTEARKCDGFTYVWEQARYNPIDRHILCHIHFRFRDGSVMKRAFTYDWRLWTIPEVRECLAEAGFARTLVFWDPVDEDEYRLTEEEENQEGWLVYILGVK